MEDYDRPAWLASVRDAATAAEVQRAVRGLAESVRPAWLQPWYAGLARLSQSRGPGGPQEPHDEAAGAQPARAPCERDDGYGRGCEGRRA